MIHKINKIIDKKIRPYLREHYGDINVVGCNDGIVEVELMGCCKGCPSANYTIENIVETWIKEEIPQVKEVVAVNQISQELYEVAKKILNKNREY